MIHNLPAYASSKNVEMTIVKVQNNCLLILGLDFPELNENNKLMVTPFKLDRYSCLCVAKTRSSVYSE